MTLSLLDRLTNFPFEFLNYFYWSFNKQSRSGLCFSCSGMQDEVRHRRDEFAKLLDEHEQVVRELRRIESSGELQSFVETPSGGRSEEAPSLGLNQEEWGWITFQSRVTHRVKYFFYGRKTTRATSWKESEMEAINLSIRNRKRMWFLKFRSWKAAERNVCRLKKFPV